MAGIPVQDELTPMGNYYLIRAKNVDVEGIRLDKVINQVRSSIEAIKTDFYTKEQSDAKYASKTDLNAKEDDIKHFKTWAEYEAAKNTIPSGAMFVVDEDNPENKIPKHNLLEGRDEANAHPYTAIEGLQAQLDKKTDVSKTQTLESRMNQFAKLPEGSTAGDAELADIRVGVDGKTYDQAGEAVRGQITSLKETIADLEQKGYPIVSIGEAVDYWMDENGDSLLKCGTVINFEYIRNEGFKHYYSFDNAGQAVYGACMSFCKTPSGFAVMMIPIEYLYNYVDGSITDKAIIIEYNNSFEEIRRSGELKLYHGSNMYYYDGNIYANANSSGSDVVKKIVVVNYNNLTVTREISINENSNFVFVKDGYMFTGTRSHIEKRNIDGTLIESKTLSGLPALFSLVPYRNGYIATANYPNRLYLLDDDFNITRVFSVFDIENRGEIKDIAFIGDDIYIPYNDRSYIRANNYEVSECYSAIIHVNIKENVTQSIFEKPNNTNNPTAYVDTNTTAKLQTGSTAAPFATVLQAVRHGYKNIYINHSDGCYVFGNNDIAIIGKDRTDAIVYLGTITRCNAMLSNVTVNEALTKSEFTFSDVKLQSIISNTDIYAAYSNVSHNNTSLKITDEGFTNLNIPTTVPQNKDQKYFMMEATTGKIPVPFDSFSGLGIYLMNLRIVCNGLTFATNIVAPSSGFINQYFTAVARKDSKNHTLTGYLTVNITNGVMTPTVTTCEYDGVATSDFSLTRFAISHLV